MATLGLGRCATSALLRGKGQQLFCALPTCRRTLRVVSFKEDEKTHQKQQEMHKTAAPQKQEERSVAKQEQGAPPATQQRAMPPVSFRRFNDMLAQMQRDMDMMMGDFFPGQELLPRGFSPLMSPGLGLLAAPLEAMEAEAAWALPVEVEESDTAYHISAEVPGFSKEEVKASLSPEGVMTLRGEHKEEETQGEGKEPRMRRTRMQSFSRSFRLPNDARTDDIAASVKNGILTVSVPKVVKKEAEHKEIPIV